MSMLCTVHIKEVIMYYDILLGTNFVSTIRNREVSTFGRVLKYCINSPSIGTASSVLYMEVSIKGGSTVSTHVRILNNP